MKSSNLAWRMEPQEEPPDAPPPAEDQERGSDEAQRIRSRTRFEHRTIEIRDQGFAPFRVR
jgi:hypothetical protein